MRVQFILFISMHKIIFNKLCAYQHSCFFHCIHIQNPQRKPLNLGPLCKHFWLSNFLFEFPLTNFVNWLVFKVSPSWFSYKKNFNSELFSSCECSKFLTKNHDIPISLAWELSKNHLSFKEMHHTNYNHLDKMILPTTKFILHK